ncbi:MAG: GIY-YIG nuclease family protein [Pseudomonadota bacterium]
MPFYVYILASQQNGTLYIGSTDDLAKRVHQHKIKASPDFTSKYGVDQLVWSGEFDTRDAAKSRERQLKAWKRAWKIKLIEETNPHWRDLYEDLNK